MNISEAIVGKVYIVKEILTDDKELHTFLLSLGCYPAEEITLMSKSKDNVVVEIKGAKYSIDSNFAKIIILESSK